MSMIRRLRVRVQRLLGDDIVSLIARGAGVVFGIQVASFGLRYLVHLGLARWMGATEYGTYVFVVSVATILAIAAKMGLPIAALRFVSEYQEENEWGRLHGVVKRLWTVTLLAGGGIAALAYGGVELLDRVGYVDHPVVLQVGVWLIPVLGLMTLQKEMVRGLEHMTLAYAPSYIGRHLLILLAVGGAYLLIGPVDSLTAVTLTGGGIALIVLVQAALGWRVVPESARHASPKFETKKWFRVALPLLLFTSFHVVLGQSDLFLLGVLRESVDVGTYNIALKTSTVVTFLLTGVNAVAGPRIAKMHQSGNEERMQRLVTLVVHLSFWPSLFGALALIAIAGPFLSIFGEEFVVARWAMIIVIVGKLFNAGAGSVGYLMNMTGHQDASAYVLGWSAALNVVLNLVLIPKFGIEGAAAATATTTAFWNVWLCWVVQKKLGVVAHIFRKPLL